MSQCLNITEKVLLKYITKEILEEKKKEGEGGGGGGMDISNGEVFFF